MKQTILYKLSDSFGVRSRKHGKFKVNDQRFELVFEGGIKDFWEVLAYW
jgi:hypothetical protein